MDSTFDLDAFLRALPCSPEQPMLYVPNPGNAGDSAIAAATYQRLDRLGIPYEAVGHQYRQSTSGRVVVYGGGGNLMPLYNAAADFMRRHHQEASRFVLLPHTVNGHEALLGELGANVDLICREERSLAYASAAAPNARVHLHDDMALSLDVAGAIQAVESGVPVEGQLTRALLPGGMEVPEKLGARAVLRLMGAALGRRKLDALRTDKESRGAPRSTFNIDVSRIFGGEVVPREDAMRTTGLTLRYLDRFATIETDRLHVAVLSALLGKNVLFHGGNYYKNEAVYRQSMEGRFPNVRWMG